jgi:hypothetical protein
MPEFRSSPEGLLLEKLAKLHRSERAPTELAARVSARVAELSNAPLTPLPERRSRSVTLRGLRWAAAPAAAAALTVVVARLGSDGASTPISESKQGPDEPSVREVWVTGVAVPGSLRWRQSGVRGQAEEPQCQYVFLLQPEGSPGSQPIQVRWTQCEFPEQLQQTTSRRHSPLTGAPSVEVSVVGHWSAPGQLEASDVQVQGG